MDGVYFNGDTKGDEKGEYIFTGGKKYTVINYAIGDKKVKGKMRVMERMRIGNKIDSDHHPEFG